MDLSAVCFPPLLKFHSHSAVRPTVSLSLSTFNLFLLRGVTRRHWPLLDSRFFAYSLGAVRRPGIRYYPMLIYSQPLQISGVCFKHFNLFKVIIALVQALSA